MNTYIYLLNLICRGETPTVTADLKPLGTDAEKPYLDQASCLIAVFAKTKQEDEETGVTSQTYYPIESTCLATGILITALHTAGIATLTHTPKPMRFLNEILGLENYFKPLFLLVTGYPEEPVMVPKIERKPFNEIATVY